MITVLFLTSLSTALADEEVGDDFSTSITISPFLLAEPVLELTGERKLSERVSTALIAGGGQSGGVALWELGCQGRVALLGDFHKALQAGVEVLYIGSVTDHSGIRAVGTGFAGGPFIGGKWVADVGFTADLQIGVAGTYITASASSGSTSAQQSEADLTPLLNINLGWSF